MTTLSMVRLEKIAKARLHRHLIDPVFDWRLGIETNGVHPPSELGLQGINAGHAIEYMATPAWVLDRALNALAIDPTEFVFIDVGSGKGRALLRAARRAFRRVEGIELSEPLNQIAARNIARAKKVSRIRSPITLRCMDIMQYELPPQPLIMFMFNPFDNTVMQRFRDKLEASLGRHPRNFHLIYLNPKQRQLFDQSTVLREVGRTMLAKICDRLISPWPLVTYSYQPQEKTAC